MRRDRGNGGELGTGGLHAADVSVEIFGQAGTIVRFDIGKDPRGVGVGDDDVEGEVALLAPAGQTGVVVDGGTYTKTADQAQAARSWHGKRVPHRREYGCGGVGVRADYCLLEFTLLDSGKHVGVRMDSRPCTNRKDGPPICAPADLVLYGFVRNLEAFVDDGEGFAQLLFVDAERRIGEERVPAHQRVEALLAEELS